MGAWSRSLRLPRAILMGELQPGQRYQAQDWVGRRPQQGAWPWFSGLHSLHSRRRPLYHFHRG